MTYGTGPGWSLALAYDPQGRLASTTSGGVTTDYLYDGPRLVAEYDASGGLLRRYVHGEGVDEPLVWYEGAGTGDRRALMQDRQGSVIGWSDGAGVVTAARVHAYGPWGEPTTWTGGRFRYTGQIALPEAGLYYYKARLYDPAAGRFLQTDPVGYEAGLNLYAYVANDPVNMTDPSGMIQVAVRLYGEKLDYPFTGHMSTVYTDMNTGEQFTVNGGPVPGGSDSGLFSEPLLNRAGGVVDKLLGGDTYDGNNAAGKPGLELIDSAVIGGNLDDARGRSDSYVDRFNAAEANYDIGIPPFPSTNSNTLATGDFYNQTGRVPDTSGASRMYPGANSPTNPINPPPYNPLAACQAVGKC